MRILIVEDNQQIADTLKTSLEAECFAVDVAYDGEEGSQMGRINDYDLIILDHMLPKKDGPQVGREIKEKNKDIYIIFLSAKTDPDTKAALIEEYADDYLNKPFSFSELLSRIRSLLRRSTSSVVGDTLIVDDLTIHLKRQMVARVGYEIYVTRQEYMLLVLLATNPGTLLSRGIIMEKAWDRHADPLSKTIDTHIRNLRKKIELPGLRKMIRTFPGRGYMLE